MFDLLPCWAESNPSAIERNNLEESSINWSNWREHKEHLYKGQGDVLELHDCVCLKSPRCFKTTRLVPVTEDRVDYITFSNPKEYLRWAISASDLRVLAPSPVDRIKSSSKDLNLVKLWYLSTSRMYFVL
jgi:hypothetical protein